MALNIQEMAQSAYNIVKQLQESATQLVGYDTLWCRAIPEPNSEDVVLQEYTLTNVGVECPKPLKVMLVTNDYNAGNFTVDLFGVNYQESVEIHINIDDWHSVYGINTMPQKGDIIYIKMIHKLYEVSTSQVMYTVASMPTYFKCMLSKYNPTASRRETEEFRLSVDELTVSQQELFGDEISKEVADVAVDVETAYNTTSYVDPMKDFDINSIIPYQIIGEDRNIISNAYYDMSITKTDVFYHIEQSYPSTSERNHLIFSCWFRNVPSDIEQLPNDTNGLTQKKKKEKQTEGIINTIKLYSKEKSYWYFRITTTLNLVEGEIITLTRGTLLAVNAEVCQIPTETALGIKIKTSEIMKANKKLTEWWMQKGMKAKRALCYKLCNGGDFSIDVNTSTKDISIMFGNNKHTFNINKLDTKQWTYLATDLSQEEIRLVVYQIKESTKQKTTGSKLLDETYLCPHTDTEFEMNGFTIPSNQLYNICNIRLYENEYPMEETYLQDMYSPVTRNASKLILVDAPNVQNKLQFVSPVR